MPRYDLTDEKVIAAPPEPVWGAVLAEMRGESSWWRPYVELRRRGDAPVDQPGAVLDIAVQPDGERRRPIEPRISWRLVAVEPNRRLRGEYFAGWFRGTSEWALDPVERGTLVRFRWIVRTHGILPTLLGWLEDIGQRHSEVTSKGLEGLARHLAATPAHSKEERGVFCVTSP